MPLAAVIVLAVMLITGIVSMIDSIPYSIRTIYGYSRLSLGITPRGDPTQTPIIRRIIEREAPVPVSRIATCRTSTAEVRSIVGKWPFVVLALRQDDMRFMLDRLGMRRLAGRLPMPGEAAAVVSDPVARNLKLRIGSELLGPERAEAFSPQSVKVVGIAQTSEWVMLAPIEYHEANHFPAIDVLLAFARDPSQQAALDAWAEKRFKGMRAQVFTYRQLEEQTQSMFDILYAVLNVVIGTLVLVITLMMAMLMNIFLTQRLPEFALLQALGYTRSRILSRVFLETTFVVAGGWAAGMGLAFGLLTIVKRALMDPNAFAIDLADRNAVLYTIPVPVAIFLAAAYTVLRRFRRFDPVAIVERRLA